MTEAEVREVFELPPEAEVARNPKTGHWAVRIPPKADEVKIALRKGHERP